METLIWNICPGCEAVQIALSQSRMPEMCHNVSEIVRQLTIWTTRG